MTSKNLKETLAMSLHSFYFNGDPYLSIIKGMYDALSSAEPLIKLVGAPGTGKTRLCEKVTQYMRKKGHQAYLFEQVFDSPEELHQALTATLQLPESHNLAKQMEERLSANANSRVTLIFDNADKFNKNLIKLGYNSKNIEDKFHFITYESFNDLKNAKKHLSYIKNKINKNAWIYSN